MSKLLGLVCLALFSLTGPLQLATCQSKSEVPFYAPLEYNQRFLDDQIVSVAKPGKVIYVDANAAIGGAGTQASPLNTLEAARDAIRELKQSQSGLPKGGVQVILMEGTFHRDKPFQLTEQDSGTREAPIVYRGATGKKVIISGGTNIDLSKSKRVEGAELKWLHPAARGKLLCVDLPDRVRESFDDNRSQPMVAMDGHMLDIAQWPNRGYNHIAEVIDIGPTTRNLKPNEKPMGYSKENPTGGKFTIREPLSDLVEQEFRRTGSMRAEGYLHNDWYFQQAKIGGIKDGVVQLLRHTRYGVADKIKSIPRRVRITNVLAELDQAGEWYYDSGSGKLFFWPIKNFDVSRSVLTALNGSELVRMNKASFVTLSHLVFENIGETGIRIFGGEHNLIAGSTIRNGRGRGITIDSGIRCGISGCEFYGLGNAFSINGGEVKTLKRCHCFATNNEIHSCRRRGYGVISLSGVGIYFGHNLLHDMNGAVIYRTVDSLLEFNEFYNIGYEMGDFNVAYCGALWHTMNNVVRFNFVHHLLEPGGHPVAGFRNDDGGAGMKVYGNVFYRSGRGSVQFAGPLNDFINNISIDSYMMWWTLKSPVSKQDVEQAWKNLDRFGRDLPHGDKGDNIFIMEKILGKKGWLKSPWSDEFPELGKVIEINPFAQIFCNVKTNYVGRVRNPFHIHNGSGDVKGMESGKVGVSADLPNNGVFESPWPITPTAFENLDSLNFKFKSSFKPIEGFEPIPFEKIGLVKDDFRPNPPNKSDYRTKVLLKFKNQEGGKYDAEVVNQRYPKRSYE